MTKLRQQLGAPGGAETRVKVIRPPDNSDTDVLIAADITVTLLWIMSGATALALGRIGRAVYVAASGVMFFTGLALMVAAIVVAARRSRTDKVDVIGLFLLPARVAGKKAQMLLWSSLFVQVVAGLGFAFARPFTILAIGTLTWVFGLGCNGMWSSRYGAFPPQTSETK
jgi:hypothetical protein